MNTRIRLTATVLSISKVCKNHVTIRLQSANSIEENKVEKTTFFFLR